jgi:hypothetical protein
MIISGYWVIVLPKNSIFDAAAGLSFDRVKCRAIDNVYSNDSVAGCHSQAGPGQALAHYWDVILFLLRIFSSKAGLFVPGCAHPSGEKNSPPVGARPAANVQHDNEISRCRWQPCRQRDLPGLRPKKF